MSENNVLDSYAVLAFLENERGGEKVSGMLKRARDKENPLFLSVVNWGEVYYIACRTSGKLIAERVLQTLDALPIEIVPIDREITKIAAEFKSSRKMSYADCFAAALAKVKKAAVVTGDREFKEVEEIVDILWI